MHRVFAYWWQAVYPEEYSKGVLGRKVEENAKKCVPIGVFKRSIG